MNIHNIIIGTAIFLVVYFCIVSGKIHRTVAAVLGGMLMILLKIVPQDKAFLYVDWNVVFLLVGMMIIVAVIGKTGFLQYLAIKSAKAARGDPYLIMGHLIFITAIFSAFLDNVTTVVFIAPISILIARDLEISPIPFLISEAIASNVGGTATLIGDPPNIMIGSAAHISFLSFLNNVAPPILLILIFIPLMMKLLMKEKMKVTYERKARIMEFDSAKLIQDKNLLKKTLIGYRSCNNRNARGFCFNFNASRTKRICKRIAFPDRMAIAFFLYRVFYYGWRIGRTRNCEISC